ncbi:ribosomal-processing cysteine protease Prp [Tissierella carlieri]|uniref:Ribosomal-processing cysteine protease Prp n=1 Tax=Tissierella carlieri TaxID=689904 RepID=A0ABT1SB70_9FIRM|nr:ribosomal-processing cysteine protease Prp [Tissierella carlieri]MBU5311219.1 ribosomal-processing cysteine protease Prp [Tissierella carlieri]MCQ4923728.1 ribosomal-processing cysteine protease Prp [Tissierella carlieri]
MIIAKIYRDKNNYIKKYTIEGHADYDLYGKDIVCAAISVLSQTTLLSLVEVCEIEENTIKYSIDEKTGFLDVELPKNIEKLKLDKAQVLLESLVVGINSVIESYPEYVALKNGEV